MSDRPPSLADVAVTIALLLSGLAGLFMSLCGGVFTAMHLGHSGYSTSILMIAVPSLVIGLALVAWVRKAWQARRRSQQRRE